MVFVVAALLFQLSTVPKVVGPVFTANLATPSVIDTATTDGTRPKSASAPVLGSETDRVEATSGKGYRDPAKVNLSGDSRPRSPGSESARR